MAIKIKLIIICILLLASCSTTLFSQVYVEDFQSDDIDICSPSDVDLNHFEAKQFFERSRQVDYQIIHDHYVIAPCYIEGIMKFKGKNCDWNIQASSIGNVTCGDETNYYVCDDCEDLFE